jgi:hypothetical protein
MSTRRWAGASLGLFLTVFGAAGGCGSSDDSTPPGGDGGTLGDSTPPGACSTSVAIVEGACKLVSQNGRQFELGCSDNVSMIIEGRPVCARSNQCVNGCLDPMGVFSCLQNCRPQPPDGGGGGDAGSTPLGISCMSNADCSTGLTCLKPTDNIAPSSGPPNGICTLECATTANETSCRSFGGTCISFSSSPTAKSFCMETCTTGMVTPPSAKCHGRPDMVCAELVPTGFGCIPLCATDSDCGTRKCDLGTGFCTDFVTPGAPIGSPCTDDPDCAGAFCYPFDLTPDASSSAGVCTALCRLGNLEGCKFRTGALDAGPPVGACLLATPSADNGDVGICAQLCDSVADCTTNDPRWTCNFDPDVFALFQHRGYCWLGARPDGGGPREASAPEPRPETGAPESGAPETGAPDMGADVPPESGSDGVDTTTPPEGGADGTAD